MNLDNSLLQKKFGKNLIFKENLSKYSWFNLGGPADIFFRPENIGQLREFLIEMKPTNHKINILGAGSNTLIRDSGVNGVVIKLSSNFSNIRLIEPDTIEVGASALDRKVSDFAKNNSEWVQGMIKRNQEYVKEFKDDRKELILELLVADKAIQVFGYPSYLSKAFPWMSI